MNWELFDKLRAHIKSLPSRRFDYSYQWIHGVDRCGCVAAHCAAMLGIQITDDYQHATMRAMLQRELNITEDEAAYLYGMDYQLRFMNVKHERGWWGKREAVKRLDRIASNYTRNTISVTPENNQADREREFLVRCMAVAAEPVEVE